MERVDDWEEAAGSRKQILTDAEKAQKKEETARRRKRQLDQKLEDEKVCLTIAYEPYEPG